MNSLPVNNVEQLATSLSDQIHGEPAIRLLIGGFGRPVDQLPRGRLTSIMFFSLAAETTLSFVETTFSSCLNQ